MAAKKQTYEENIEQIDEILEKLENEELSLDDSIEEYEKEIKLIKDSEKLLEMGSTFANKVWNASRFVLSNLEDFGANAVIDEKEFKLEDRWILSKLQTASRQINEYMDKYELDSAAKVA